ncbi:MAG TPA: SDR family oxidoreductase [Verrucomicrobiae bacterium]|jgi:enoyl-[acyl-carrier protein] reductase III
MSNHSTASGFALAGTFLVTGGTRGLGRAISLQLAGAGAKVIANYLRNEKAALELKTLAGQKQLSLELCRADLTTPNGLAQVEAAVKQHGSQLAGLVHCAANGTHKPFEELTARHLQWTMALNVSSFFDLVKMFLPQFASGSSIVALSSAGGMRAVPKYSVVGASKGALESLARHLAVELAPRGIRVNLIAPGAVATEVWNAIPDQETRLAEAIRRSPSGRLVTPEEVAGAVHFLCSPAASGINGQTLIVDAAAGTVGGA